MKRLKRMTLAPVGMLALAAAFGCDQGGSEQNSGSPERKPREAQPGKSPKSQEREQPKDLPQPLPQPS